MLVKAHISSTPIPTKPSTRFTLDVDLAWQCLLQVEEFFRIDGLSGADFIIPRLISWCSYFLEAIPWEMLNNGVLWPDALLPFRLITCLLCEHRMLTPSLTLPFNTSHNSFLQGTVSTMLRISVKVGSWTRRDCLGAYALIENVFHVLYSIYPTQYVDDAVTHASKDITNQDVKALASCLALYVINKSHDFPVEHTLRLIERLSKSSPRIHDLFQDSDTTRWASRTLRVATAFLRTRDDKHITHVIDASAAYLSWLFVSQTYSSKVVQTALSQKLLPALFRCLSHETRLWATHDSVLPVATLLMYLSVRIASCPTTGRKAKVAFRHVYREQRSLEARVVESQSPSAEAPKSESESNDVYAELWVRWELVQDSIRDADASDERCANPQCNIRGRAQLKICSVCFDLRGPGHFLSSFIFRATTPTLTEKQMSVERTFGQWSRQVSPHTDPSTFTVGLHDIMITNVALPHELKGNGRSTVLIHHVNVLYDGETDGPRVGSAAIASLTPGITENAVVKIILNHGEFVSFEVQGENEINLFGHYISYHKVKDRVSVLSRDSASEALFQTAQPQEPLSSASTSKRGGRGGSTSTRSTKRKAVDDEADDDDVDDAKPAKRRRA
ncbi:hypothetical protein BDZ89DRAFT_1142613 [Hymenopellis radicata]|nr:hypothetical protein BDZ89DRAFT_1142613 [Hymenopellis radicata]